MKKKMLAVFICLVMVAGLIPTVAFAAENEVDVWDGTSDTSWYNETDTEFHIKTAEQLAGLAELTNIGIDTGASTGNTFDNKIIYLDYDLDLGDYPWTPITNRNVDDGYFFKGTFDGQGHTIYNLNRHGIGNDSFDSLFGYVQGGVIKNLNVVDADLSANDYSMHVGIIAALVENGKIINCYTSGTVESVNGWRSIGGIAGSCMQGTQIVGCGSDANIISRKSESSDSVGGLVGEWLNANKTSVISDCWFNGSIVSEDPESTVGGLLAVGYNNNVEENVKINNCMMVSSDLSSAEKEYTAVIAHLTGTPTVADCFYKESDNGYHVITKLDKGSLAIDTSFDPTPCAKAITDFTDNDILVSLQNNASQGVVWVEGIEHPTFSWDLTNRLADYTAVNVALDKVPQDISVYTDETLSVLKQAIDSVDTSLSAAEQSKVDAMAKAIEDAIAALQYKDADYTKVDAAIAKANALNKNDYKDFTGVEAAVKAVARDKNITEQSEVDAMAKAIEDAIATLQYKDADYTKVDSAIAKANALNKDNYKDFSAVETAVNAVVRDKNITEQSEVDAMAKAIEDAIATLQYKDADYTKVDAAIAKANALNKDNYKDFTGVEATVNAVTRGKNLTEQTEVDAMAKAIEDAIAALQYKDADYTKVDAAIAKANALNKDDYKDFSGVETAVKAVVRGKNITEQSEVDKMAKAIEDAIAALQYKDADYTKVDAAIAKANALNKNDYKDFSGVKTAVKAVVRGKNITEQSEVDKMARAIEDAIAALEKKPASTKLGTSDKSPQTGDSSNLALCIALLFISGGVAIGTTVVSRKKKYDR